MSKPNQPKPFMTKRTLLKLSLGLNILLVLGAGLYIFLSNYSTQRLEIAQFNYLQQDICGKRYNEYLNSFPTDQGKKAFAITTCLRNYKTGQDLDLSPLEAQVQ